MASIVIKVKFGETLRRLNVSISDSKLVINMAMLKEKIRSLFSFDSDVEFSMTYVDEDGDAVTLADDDDLHDVVRQSLNPLRITVSLSNSNFSGSSGKSTPLRSPQNHLPFKNLNSAVSEVLKSVHEPLLGALAKPLIDLASKASSSSSSSPPVVDELVEKLRAVYSSQNLPSVCRLRAHPTTGGPQNVNSVSSTIKDSTEGVKFKDVQPPRGVDLNIPCFDCASFQAPVSSPKSVGEGYTGKNKNTTDGVEKVAADVNKSANNPGSSSAWAQGMWNATSQCPFSGMPLTSDSDSHGQHRRSCSPRWKRHGLDNNGKGNIFHQGVICDGCEAHPIVGPRFKSKVKTNYDLCNACFARMGNATDYIRMDNPTNGFRHPFMPFNGLYNPRFESKLDGRFILDVNVLDGTIMAPSTTFTKIWRMRNSGSIVWPYGSQLQWIGGDRLSESHHVNVEIPIAGLSVDKEIDIAVDFTAPELPGRYVSYWMMASPSGQTFGQQIWISIQVDASMKNSNETTINLNLPPVTRDPEAVNQDYLVDNIFSGNNITSSENASADLPLKDHEMNFPFPVSSSPGTASSSVFNPTEVGTALGSLPAGPTVTSGIYPTSGLNSEPVSYPMVDFSVMPPIISSGAASLPTVAVQPSGSGKVAIDDQEQVLVKELEEMGFKQLDLNREVLRMNNYDLEKSIDDLCGVLEWDPMLDELCEMGFADDEANMRLLKKNNGSIKGVVMDLISEEKA